MARWHEFIRKCMLIGALIIFGEKSVLAVENPAEQKCMDPQFYSQASEYFACENGLSFDSCAGMTAAGAAGGGFAAVITARISEIQKAKAFERYAAAQDAYIEQKRKVWAAYNEASRFSQINGNVVDPFIRENWRHVETAFREMRANDPVKLEGLERRWRILKIQEEKARLEESLIWRKEIEPLQKQYRLSQYDSNATPSLREVLKKNAELWSDAWKAEMAVADEKTFFKYFPEYKDPAKLRALEEEASKAKANLSRFRTSELREKAFGVRRIIGRRTAIGALLGAAIVGAPLAIDKLSNMGCADLSQEAAKFIKTSSTGLGGCEATFLEGKESDLFLMDNAARTKLFSDNPMLCQAWVKASMKRIENHPKVQTTMTGCNAETMQAEVLVNGRKYTYEVSERNGKVAVKSNLGIKGSNVVQQPVSIEWSTADNGISSVNIRNFPLWSTLETDQKDVSFLNSLYSVGSSKFSPVSEQGVGAAGIQKKTDVLSTVAEQTVALKIALPEMLKACSYIRANTPVAVPDEGTTGIIGR